MNLALIGYGQMGRQVEDIALERGHKVTAVLDLNEQFCRGDLARTQVAIEFTQPQAVVPNIKTLARLGINIVVGTTGWYDHLIEVKRLVREAGIGFLWSANFSLGMHLYWKILEEAAGLVNQMPEYDVFAHELHHRRKKDSPSGTAQMIAQILLDRLDRKKRLITKRLDRQPEPAELHFSSTRGGSVPGTHSVYFDSPFDTIEMTHQARSRAGFALGAVQAAEWVLGRKGYFVMEDFIKDVFKF